MSSTHLTHFTDFSLITPTIPRVAGFVRTPRWVAAAAIFLCATAAQAQTLTPTFRTGHNYFLVGPLGIGQQVSHSFSTAVATHDPISGTDGGGGYWPIASAASNLDVVPTSTSIALALVGSASRTPIPPNGSGSTYAMASAADQWSFALSAPTCFSLDGSVSLSLSPEAAAGPQGVQFAPDSTGGGNITLASGAHAGILATILTTSGTQNFHYEGTLAAGNYFITISGEASENGSPMRVTYNNAITLRVGPPVIVSDPASVTLCSAGSATFSIGAAGPGPWTYRWQWQPTAGAAWTDLVNGINSALGQPALDVTGATEDTLRPRVLWGLGGNLPLRCVVSNGCGSTNSSAALLTICLADFNCDGSVDFFDYLDFVDALASSAANADFNHDNAIDFFDYLDFVDAFATGC